LQDSLLFKGTIRDNIAFGRPDASDAEIRAAAATAHATEFIEALPEGYETTVSERGTTLSGGQKQRIAIARCMVLDPTVLLLDEPLGALDLKLREHMKLELKQLQSQFGTTFVYITHDQSEALVMSDQVAVMNAGRFEQVGAPQDLYYGPRTAFVAGFVGDSNRWHGRVVDRDASSLKVETDSGTLVICAGADHLAAGAKVELFVRPESIAIHGPGEIAPSGAGPRNEQTGVLDDLLFNGANSRALVRTDKGEVIAVALPQTGAARQLREGAALTLSFAAEQCLCFAAHSSMKDT
jgi:spermidine/putrescine transport system ATP-binding protein